jgi:DNA-directed RNA polymerase alpha subunit
MSFRVSRKRALRSLSLWKQISPPRQIKNALNEAGVKTVGEIRQASDATLLSFQDVGSSSIARLRETLGQQPSAKGNHARPRPCVRVANAVRSRSRPSRRLAENRSRET